MSESHFYFFHNGKKDFCLRRSNTDPAGRCLWFGIFKEDQTVPDQDDPGRAPVLPVGAKKQKQKKTPHVKQPVVFYFEMCLFRVFNGRCERASFTSASCHLLQSWSCSVVQLSPAPGGTSHNVTSRVSMCFYPQNSLSAATAVANNTAESSRLAWGDAERLLGEKSRMLFLWAMCCILSKTHLTRLLRHFLRGKKQEESCSEISHCGVAPFKVHQNRLNNREVRKVYKVVHIRPAGEGGGSCWGLHHETVTIDFVEFYSTNVENLKSKTCHTIFFFHWWVNSSVSQLVGRSPKVSHLAFLKIVILKCTYL